MGAELPSSWEALVGWRIILMSKTSYVLAAATHTIWHYAAKLLVGDGWRWSLFLDSEKSL
jgi:hypothetical protein